MHAPVTPSTKLATSSRCVKPRSHMATQKFVSFHFQLWQLSLSSVRRSLSEAGLTTLLGPGKVEDGDEEE